MRTIIRGIAGPHRGAVYVLDGRVTLGRAADAHVQIPDPTVSRQHAKLVVADDGTVVLSDLSSDNGTYVDGTRIERRRLVQGDRFRIGEAEYELDVVPLRELQSSGIFGRKVLGALALRRTAAVPIVALEGSVDAKVSPHAELGFLGPVEPPRVEPEPIIEAATIIEVASLDAAPDGVHVYAARTEHSVAWSAERYGLHIVLDRIPDSFADRLSPPRSPPPADAFGDRTPTVEIPRLELEAVLDPRARDTVELPVPSPTAVPRPRGPRLAPPIGTPASRRPGAPMLAWSRGDGLRVLQDVLQFRTLQQRFLRGQMLTGEQRTRFLALSRQLQAAEARDGRQPEARRYGRFECELTSRLAPWGPRLRVLEASLADVGAGGASVRLGAGKLRVGEAVWLAVDVSEPSATQAAVIRSRVVWAQAQGERAGLMFTGDVAYEADLDAALKSVGKR